MAFPPLPEAHAMAVIIVTLVALFLFTREKIPLETSSLAVIAVLSAGFALFPMPGENPPIRAETFFLGFGHEALIAVSGLMVAGQGLVRTGALEPVGRTLARLWGFSPTLSLLLTLLVAATLSAFVNNTPVVVLLLPLLISVSIRTKTAASGILMPMGFATLIGGMATTIGTSTNLLVVAIAADLGLRHFGMFDFARPMLIAGGAGIVYLWLIAPRLLPQRESLLNDDSPRVFVARLTIPAGSFCVGKNLAEIIGKTSGSLQVRRIRRGKGAHLLPLPDAIISTGDQLVVRDTPANLKEFEQVLGAVLYSSRDTPVDEEHPLAAEDQQLAEIALFMGMSQVGKSLHTTHFMEHYQVAVLALHRVGRAYISPDLDMADIPLRVGDVLLVQGARDQIRDLKKQHELLVLDATADLPHSNRAPLALLIMAGVVVSAAFGILPISVSAVSGALLMIISRCLSWRDAAHALSTQVILIVVASLALGNALQATGGTSYLTDLFLAALGGASPQVVLSGLMLLMAIMTNLVSNNAAAVIGTPIAINIANKLGLPPEAFVLAVLFGANLSYATPMAYKTNLLVMSAGSYTFSDFLRVGIPLILLIWGSLSWLLPQMYGF